MVYHYAPDDRLLIAGSPLVPGENLVDSSVGRVAGKVPLANVDKATVGAGVDTGDRSEGPYTIISSG